MGNVTFTRIDDTTPFQVLHSDVLTAKGDRRPALILWPEHSRGVKSKASGKGFVFVHKNIAVEMLGRFARVVFMTWPETREQFKKALEECK